jgi:UDP-GlcNAc:undecaprenyl-phosphate GlcNAc-1-phosphate transferase
MKAYIYTFLTSLVLTLLITPLIIRLARKYGCIDIPDKRRFHDCPTPRWGGIAFSLGIIPVLLFLDLDRRIYFYFIASVFLVTLGAVDDLRHLNWKIKLLGLILVTTIVIFGGDIVIKHIGTYVSFGKVWLGVLAVPFTYFSVIGVTNAINLIDGLNGLAGGISGIAFLFIGIAAFLSGNNILAIMAFTFVGGLIGFLVYNFPKARIFMGDSGSYFLGFSLAIFSILLTQDDRFHVEPMFPVVVLFVPIFDTLRVMTVRIFKRRNPFKPDKTHLHHLLVRRGVSKINTVIFLWSISIVLGLIAILMIKSSSTPYLLLTLTASFILSLYAGYLGSRRRRR